METGTEPFRASAQKDGKARCPGRSTEDAAREKVTKQRQRIHELETEQKKKKEKPKTDSAADL